MEREERLNLEKLKIQAHEQRQRRELKRRLLRYDSKIIRDNFISITETNYVNIIERDPDTLLLIHDLEMKIQFKAGI